VVVALLADADVAAGSVGGCWLRAVELPAEPLPQPALEVKFGQRPQGHCCTGRGQGPSRQTVAMRPRRLHSAPIAHSAFARFCFPPDVIVLAVRWYLRFALSYRDVEELLAERGIEVDHTTVYRWVQRFAPLLADAARPCRHTIGTRWQVDETDGKVAGRWRYVYRAVDQFDQVIDVFVSPRRDATAARRFFQRAILTTRNQPAEVITDRAATYPIVLDELLPAAWHRTDQYANNQLECDHGRLKARLRPMRGLKQDRSANVLIAGHAFVQNLRRGHYELAVEAPATRRVAVAFQELAATI
jgi:transposase-like protein